ncbi:flagellar basal body-associated protein FliL [Rossellomorea vietnamensis]|uniref:Flagellar protein FliL n=1 Tax=Rossellomorea vietnamensis TaxID=218284 RepID=A0A5D4NSH5_9BACI|nr:flagellar basal body-associated protein FliL [Rossellomorea vietnamensis]TYS16276.1 flagellar basal body-associated protein FliL [Rossellomorea vietnamensis]
MKNKLLTITLILLVTITLVGVLALVVLLKFNEDETKEPTIDEVIEASVDVPELTTNLLSGDYIKISFKVQTDGKKAKEELEKRDFQVKNIIIEELSELKSDELQGKEGKQQLETTIKDKANSLMQEGKVERVYITSYIIQ